MDVQERLQMQDKRIEELQHQVELLQAAIQRLTVCKMDDPRYPYYNLVQTMNISEDQKLLLETLLGFVDMRLQGDFTVPKRNKQFAFLWEERVPTYSEVESAVLHILDISMNRGQFVDLLHAMRDQGIMREVCRYLLEQAKDVS